MKILKLRLLNLNSLVGEWEIDFTAPPFTREGIFAITGPTGAGKSTILDALCLALYGQTPRLGRITKSANQIMSRQAGECLAEATFSTRAGGYRCCWYQHRARKKPGGELQNPRHEIVETATGRPLSTKLREVVELVTEVTGLDFEQFTRSMLLAQGGFALFLKARPDERSPILEQLTGTEIYSRISQAVHERRSAELKKLERLGAALENLAPLAEEAAAELRRRLEEKRAAAAARERELKELDRTLARLERLAELEKEQRELELEQRKWRQESAAFAADELRRQRAARAQALAAFFEPVRLGREQLQKLAAALAEGRDGLPASAAAVRAAAERLQRAERERDGAEKGRRELARLLLEVRALDQALRAQAAEMSARERELNDRERELQRHRNEREEKSRSAETKRGELAELREKLSASAADAGLPEALSGIRERGAALKELEQRCREREKAAAEAALKLAEAQRERRREVSAREAVAGALRELEQALEEKRGALSELLGERPLAGWRAELDRLQARERLLERAQTELSRLQDSEQELSALVEHAAELQRQGGHLARELAQVRERLAAQAREEELTAENLRLKQRIASFAEARRELSPGKPCPLCGALEHPFAADPDPAGGRPDAERLRILREKLEKTRMQLLSLTAEEARRDSEREQAANRRRSLEQELAELREGCAARLRELAFTDDAGSALPAARVAAELEATQRRRQETAARIARAEIGERELEERLQAREEARKRLAESEKSELAAELRERQAAREKARLEQESAELRQRLAAARADYAAVIGGFGFPEPTAEMVGEIESELARRRELWLSRRQRETELEQELAGLAGDIQRLTELEKVGRTERERKLEDLAVRRREYARQAAERRELFGERDPDREEEVAGQAVADADARVAEARRRHQQEERELDRRRTRIAELVKEQVRVREELAAAEKVFAERLREEGFRDEADFLAARLPAAERAALDRAAAALERRRTALETRERELAKRRAALAREQETGGDNGHSRDELARLRAAREAELQELQREIGARQRQLEENEELLRQQAERRAALAAQERECRRWNLLHELIGSADGKKFRNFAQGLTFRSLIAQANRRLVEITDRYLLVQSEAHPLELDVIDSWQGGEIRSTRNLSGGESFIISLALALGLSRMAGRRIRIDSLFLDEGFGTLDEEALEAALEALAGLQQSGKLIGIISHVPALKERIAVRIEVIPIAGGRSRIAGPGCKQIP